MARLVCFEHVFDYPQAMVFCSALEAAGLFVHAADRHYAYLSWYCHYSFGGIRILILDTERDAVQAIHDLGKVELVEANAAAAKPKWHEIILSVLVGLKFGVPCPYWKRNWRRDYHGDA